MAESPAQQLADILTNALNQWAQDNPDLFTVNVNSQGSGDNFATGFDPLTLLTNLLQAGILAQILGEIGGPIPTLVDGAVAGGGKSFVEFILEFALGWIIPQLLEPFITDAQNQVNKIATPGRFDINTAADMANKGFYPLGASAEDALETGYDNAHFTAAQAAALNWPGMAQIFSMWNRGYVGDNDAFSLLQSIGTPPDYISQIAALRQELLSPADWALAALRKNVTVEDATAGASMWGLSADDFNTLMLNTGEPPGTMLLLEAYRRGFIDEATLEQGILQSRVRDEWIPTLEKLRYAPMSTAAAANAVVRGYLSYDDGATIAQDNGLEPDHWQYVYESNGRPPSHGEMMELYYRGLVNLTTVQNAIKQSDIKDEYIPEVIELGVKLLPLFEASTLFKDGNISAKTFTQQMLDQGYQSDMIAEIVTSVSSGTATTPKRLTEAEIVDMYEDGSLSKDQAASKLVSIGYQKADATALLSDADVRAAAARTKTLITTVRTQYDRYQIDSDTAKSDLETIGVDSSTITRLLHDWEVVRPPGTKRLTEPQILRLLKLKKISSTEAVTRLQADGYSEADAQILVSTVG